MGQTQCKMLYLPAQSGKTGKMEELIIQEKEINGTHGDCNFIISDNNIVLTTQTRTRVTKDLGEGEEPVIEEGIFSWTSAPGECKLSEELSIKCKLSVEELAWYIITGKVDTVVMCAHPTRIKYLTKLINSLCKSGMFTKKINIWIDEADKSIKLWSKAECQALLEYKQLSKVTLISATIDSIIAKYKEIRLIPYSVTHPSCYRGFKDSKRRVLTELSGDSVEDALAILQSQDLLRPGKRGFVPMDITTDTHDLLDEALRKMGVATMVLNGHRKEIYVPGIDGARSRTHDISNDMKYNEAGEIIEISSFLAQFYKDYDLEQVAFVITGHRCLSRGVTFQSNKNEANDGFLFDYEILPDIRLPAEAYQTAARGFGNVKRPKRLRLYASESMLRKIEKQEKMAMNTPKLAHEGGYEMIDKARLKEAQALGDPKYTTPKRMFLVYDDEDTVSAVFELLGYNKYRRVKLRDGFCHTSLNRKSEKASLLEAIFKVETAYGYNEEGEKVWRNSIPCYKDMSDPDSLRIVVIIHDVDDDTLERVKTYYTPVDYESEI